MSDQSKLRKQTEKLGEMKESALSKLTGLEDFYFMIWTKVKFDHNLKDEEIMSTFKNRFASSLPLKYIDLVLLE